MSRNGWIACFIVVIVLACVVVFCVFAGALGVAGYLSISPTISLHLPFIPDVNATITPSPVVIRPIPDKSDATPVPSATYITPQIESPSPVVEPNPAGLTLVPTDTLYSLENTFIPINDPIELANRLLNLGALSPTQAPRSSAYAVGDHETFWAGTGNEENFRVQATLQQITDHAYFWIEDGIRFSNRDLSDLAKIFEEQIYPTNRAFFGSEWTPGVDGDPRIYIVYARNLGEGIAGYFSSADEYPPQINRYSNSHEMFLFNADNSPLDNVYTFGVLAHEFQHMIHWHQDRNEPNWINEGFSELAVLLNNFYYGGFDTLYASAPDLQLNEWPDDTKEDATPHYGASFLFLAYFLDRFGENATKMLVANQDNGFNGIDSVLSQVNAIDAITNQPIRADDFFQDWTVTNYLLDSHVADGRYNYHRYSSAPSAQPSQSYAHCPLDTVTNDVHQYGVDYIRFTCPGSYTLHFEGSIQAPLLPQNPHSGQYAFWANKSDESDTTLTQSFDFTNYSGPLTLSYWTWYNIEDGWDYVYLEASQDGKNWQVLNTPSGTDVNPQGNNYGWGYTGDSGGGSTPTWIQEKVDLSEYAGHNLILRFEYITDSNVTGEGFLLDDLSIPEIGYSTDFEIDASGWQSDGWARIENVLPQSYRLAVIYDGSSPGVQYFTPGPDATVDIPFTIGNGVDRVTLVVSGTTRFTRQHAPYRFNVSIP